VISGADPCHFRNCIRGGHAAGYVKVNYQKLLNEEHDNQAKHKTTEPGVNTGSWKIRNCGDFRRRAQMAKRRWRTRSETWRRTRRRPRSQMESAGRTGSRQAWSRVDLDPPRRTGRSQRLHALAAGQNGNFDDADKVGTFTTCASCFSTTRSFSSHCLRRRRSLRRRFRDEDSGHHGHPFSASKAGRDSQRECPKDWIAKHQITAEGWFVAIRI